MGKGLFMVLIIGLLVWVPLDILYCWFSGSPSFFADFTHLAFVSAILTSFFIAFGLMVMGEWVWRKTRH